MFVHFSTIAADGADEARRLVAYLRARGFAVADIRAVSFPIATPKVRYFFADDAAAARRLTGTLAEFQPRQGGSAWTRSACKTTPPTARCRRKATSRSGCRQGVREERCDRMLTAPGIIGTLVKYRLRLMPLRPVRSVSC